MPDPTLELQSQIEQLESRLAAARKEIDRLRNQTQTPQSGRLRRAVLSSAACLLLMAASPAPVSDVRFRVVDKAGIKIFEVSEGDSRGFTIFDTKGKAALAARALPTVAIFKAAKGNVSAGIGLVNSGTTPVFALKIGEDSRVAMAVANDGRPTLNMTNDNNIVMLDVGEGAAGGGILMLTDAKGDTKVQMGTLPNGVGVVTTFPNGAAGGAMVGLKGTLICGVGCSQ
ncbi:MAG TPA: hypothetical protein VEW69_05640 [Alphaproteobacteria bacterium]|nr:hypothetical protein [Alphaproteobacteria bacterium]